MRILASSPHQPDRTCLHESGDSFDESDAVLARTDSTHLSVAVQLETFAIRPDDSREIQYIIPSNPPSFRSRSGNIAQPHKLFSSLHYSLERSKTRSLRTRMLMIPALITRPTLDRIPYSTSRHPAEPSDRFHEVPKASHAPDKSQEGSPCHDWSLAITMPS